MTAILVLDLIASIRHIKPLGVMQLLEMSRFINDFMPDKDLAKLIIPWSRRLLLLKLTSAMRSEFEF